MVKRIRVTNKGERIRSRLGVSFYPNQPVEITVTDRTFIVIKAVKDFEVEILDEGKDIPQNEVKREVPENFDGLDLAGMTAKEVIKTVKTGIISIDEAIEREKAGRNRKSLIEQLEGMKKR